MGTFILPQTAPADNSQPTAPAIGRTHRRNNNNLISVELLKDCRTLTTNKVLPAGTIGKVVDTFYQSASNGYKTYWQIDFGLMTVQALPIDSPLIKVLGVTV